MTKKAEDITGTVAWVTPPTYEEEVAKLTEEFVKKIKKLKILKL